LMVALLQLWSCSLIKLCNSWMRAKLFICTLQLAYMELSFWVGTCKSSKLRYILCWEYWCWRWFGTAHAKVSEATGKQSYVQIR
jgi:hypothetical protein